MKNRVNNSLFNKQLVNASFVESFRKLDPRVMIKNPIMFTVEVVTFVMLLLIVWIAVTGNTSQGSLGYNIVIFLVLLATVLFANFAEAIAEARGKAQADSLRKTREETPAKRIEKDGQSHIVSSSALRKGDRPAGRESVPRQHHPAVLHRQTVRETVKCSPLIQSLTALPERAFSLICTKCSITPCAKNKKRL